MSAKEQYQTAAAFRVALEHRLRDEARQSGVALQRLRKEAAFNRLLARLQRVAPHSWALKGGLALIARLGSQVRATKDADANWRATQQTLEDALDTIEDLDIGDWFTFSIGDGRALLGEGDAGALRYPVTSRLDSRTFEQLSFDVNISGADDDRPTELVTVSRNPFAFVSEPPLRIPMITPAQQLAEKLHAYTRRYDDEPSSRAKDLFDTLVIADHIRLPDGATFSAEVQRTFAIRSTPWPPQLTAPPTAWTGPWKAFVAEYPLPWRTVEDAYSAFRRFWEPVLQGAAARIAANWQSDDWHWT